MLLLVFTILFFDCFSWFFNRMFFYWFC
jgi:hypothetical protein